MFRTLAFCLMILAPAVFAAGVGDDGLHDAPWIEETFKDLREDHATAAEQGKTLMIIIEQRGCIYCTRLHEEVFTDPEVEAALTDHFYVVQLNMYGDLDVTDFDGEVLAEKDMVRRWNALFTPYLMFFPPEVSEGAIASESTIVSLPGAFGKWTTLNLLTWVAEGHYDGGEEFQRYHARILQERGIVE